MQLQPVFHCSSRSTLESDPVDRKSRQYYDIVMVPAFGMIILPQNRSTENGQAPGCSCIITMVIRQRLILGLEGLGFNTVLYNVIVVFYTTCTASLVRHTQSQIC